MCGAYNVIDNPFTHDLAEFFGVYRLSNFGWQNCGQTIEIILNQGDGNRLEKAIWWLLLEPGDDDQLKPHRKYTTFNSRWNNGFSRANAGPFKTSRCVIPASGFIESLDKRYWYLEPKDQAIAFGGLYKTWNTQDGLVVSCSIITLPPHPRMENIHKKSMPLMLPLDQPEILEKWLDPSCTDTQNFKKLMEPVLRTDFSVNELSKWGSLSAKPSSEYTLNRD